MRSRGLVGVVAIATTVAICGSASAATICVPTFVTGCDSSAPTLADAMTAANGIAGTDEIQLEPGTFPVSPGVVAGLSNPVHIVGSGMERTVIEGTYSSGIDPYTLSMYGADQLVSNLTIHESASGHSTALYLSDGAAAQRVRADQRDNTRPQPYAVSLQNGSSFADGEALNRLPLGTLTTYGAVVNGGAGQTGRITNSLVQGGYGVSTSGAGTAIVSRSRIVGEYYAVNAQGATNLVEDSLVSGGPLAAYDNVAADVALVVRHVTLQAVPIEVDGYHDGNTASASVSNTAFTGFGPEQTQAIARTSGTGAAQLTLGYSFYGGPALVDDGTPNTTFTDAGTNVLGMDAKLVNPASDPEPRFDSPLVDAGDPAVADGETALDLGGGPRTVNGRTDIGAYEYGRHAPTVSVSVNRSNAFVGDQIQFTALTQDPDPGEATTVVWTFDDGTTATGSPVTHAFTVPGTHSATATATDPVGLTAQAVTSVVVISPSVLNKPLAPTFPFAKLRARRGIVRVPLRCPVAATDCAGTLSLRLAPRPKAKGARVIVLGRAHYAVRHGTKRTVRVKLTRSARRRLARARHGLRVRVVATPKDAAARSRTVRLTGR